MEEKATLINDVITVLSIVFVLAGASLVAFFIYFKKRKAKLIAENEAMESAYHDQLNKSRTEIQEHTFQQIGKELHDNVGQLLSTSRMLLGITERSLPNPPETLLNANATLGQAINEIRALSRSLDREWLERFDFVENLNMELDRVNSGNTLEAGYHYDKPLSVIPDHQIILFRIVQEAVQNTIKHSGAGKLDVTSLHEEGKLLIIVADDGIGLPADTTPSGMGLVNMKNRTALLGGTIEWQSPENNGTLIIITIPVSNDNYENKSRVG